MFKRRKKFNSVDELRAGDKFKVCYFGRMRWYTVIAKRDDGKLLVSTDHKDFMCVDKDNDIFYWFKALNS